MADRVREEVGIENDVVWGSQVLVRLEVESRRGLGDVSDEIGIVLLRRRLRFRFGRFRSKSVAAAN